MAQPDIHQEVIDNLKRTVKYRHLCEDTLCRIAHWAAVRHPSARMALKAAKRKLHQVYGAYIDRIDFSRIEAVADGPPCPPTSVRIQRACVEILRGHASTAERLPIIDEFYPHLFREIGQPGSLLDIACGLNPFALPWMGLSPRTRYVACDIDGRLVSLIRSFLTRVGQTQDVACRDVLVSSADQTADVAFLFKTVPCLEQQEKGAGVALLRRVRADVVVVSFPTHSLGGREKGMAQQYEGTMARIVDELKLPVRKMTYPGEIFYILEK